MWFLRHVSGHTYTHRNRHTDTLIAILCNPSLFAHTVRRYARERFRWICHRPHRRSQPMAEMLHSKVDQISAISWWFLLHHYAINGSYANTIPLIRIKLQLRFFMKLVKTSHTQIVTVIQLAFGFRPPSAIITDRVKTAWKWVMRQPITYR